MQRAEDSLKEFEKVQVISDEQFEGQNNILEFNQEISYNFHVWLSGAHMRIANVLKTDDPSKAREHLEKAKQIIDSDSRLTLRSKQWEKLTKEFK